MRMNNKGFTLLEVLISIVILTVAMLAASKMMTASMGTGYVSNRVTIATILAQDKMEDLLALSYDDSDLEDIDPNNFDSGANDFDWSVTPDHTDDFNPINEEGDTIAGAGPTQGYYRFWNVADDTPAEFMKTISVRVTWTEKAARSFTITSVKSQGE